MLKTTKPANYKLAQETLAIMKADPQYGIYFIRTGASWDGGLKMTYDTNLFVKNATKSIVGKKRKRNDFWKNPL